MEGYHYVYILRSKNWPERHYTGCTNDLHRRLTEHNSGHVGHTRKFRPWIVKTAFAFEDRQRARAFEAFLKSTSRPNVRQETALTFGVSLPTTASTVADCLKLVGDLPNLHAAAKFYVQRFKQASFLTHHES